jgi:hypothetical protein
MREWNQVYTKLLLSRWREPTKQRFKLCRLHSRSNIDVGEDLELVMRNLIAALSVVAALGTALGSIPSAEAGLITTPRQASASTDQVSLDQANQQAEDQLGLTRGKWRDVQRRLTKLGFGAKASGRSDGRTREAIANWQASRGYPNTGLLDADQYKALLGENIVAADARTDRASHRHSGRRAARQSRGIGNPIRAVGGAVVGLFRHL